MHRTHPVDPAIAASGRRFACIKAMKRLFIQDTATGALLYTHPNWIRLPDRRMMQDLADAAEARGRLDIADIMAFEDRAPRAPSVRKHPRDRGLIMPPDGLPAPDAITARFFPGSAPDSGPGRAPA